MLVIPGGLMALIALHLYLVVRLGVTSPPWSKEAAGTGPMNGSGPTGRAGMTRPGPRGGQAWLTTAIVERRRVFQQYKADVKERGKPFYPYAMLHDTIMSLVVVA